MKLSSFMLGLVSDGNTEHRDAQLVFSPYTEGMSPMSSGLMG